MNRKFAELLDRVAQWPPDAQEDAILTLEGIEARVMEDSKLTPEQREAKLNSLREMIQKSIERGGNYTDEEVEASISAALDAREQGRKSA